MIVAAASLTMPTMAAADVSVTYLGILRFYVVYGAAATSFGGSVGAVQCSPVGLCSNIFPAGKLRSNGRVVVVGGPIQCEPGDTTTLRITVTQRATAAIGQIGLKGKCPHGLKAWRYAVRASANRFIAGRAFACVLGALEQHEVYTDARQWCRWVKLA
jgi:hypothetical protein